jgi:hypothetical protein
MENATLNGTLVMASLTFTEAGSECTGFAPRTKNTCARPDRISSRAART